LKTTTFRAREVGEYFNSNFINISINGETEEGIKIINKYNLTAYPTLLIIDKNKKLLAISEGYKSPRDLIDFGKKSLCKIK
jgi:protein-disulfide isomerase-like protein with CxxC motif